MCKEDKVKLRKLFALLTIASLTLAGCSQAEPEPEVEEIVLKLAIQDAGYGTAHWEHIIETFEAEYPNVSVEMTASPDIGTLISTLAQAGDDEEMFDLIQAYSPYAAEGLLEPLDDLLDMPLPDNPNILLKDAFLEGVDKMVVPEADGNVYKLPKSMWLGGLFYNKDVFEKYGWDTNPQNWCQRVFRMENWFVVAHDSGISLWNTSFPAANPEWWKNIDHARAGLIRPVTDLAFDGKYLWLSTPRGVLHLTTPVNRFFSDFVPNLVSYSRVHGLPADRINSMIHHRGALWLATNAGIARIKNEQIQLISPESGNFARRIRKLAASGDLLWLGTDSAIQFINTAMVD
jgi:hypothetical protein